MKIYYKMLKGLEAMINIQKQVKDMMKIAIEMNMTIIEMEGIILEATINNQIINTINITGISEDLLYMIQSNIEEWVFQIQRMLADELDRYKGRRNVYINENIREIQELYIEEEPKKTGTRQDKEVILIKLYEVSELTSSTRSTSFVDEEVDNLLKYIKFIKSPT